MKETKEIKAVLRSSVFYASDRSFLIGTFEAKDIGVFTALGTLPNPQQGLGYALSGKWVDNVRYGQQFKIDTYRAIEPKNPKGIFYYLVRVCKFVGPSIGKALVDKYGKDTLEMLRTDPNKIARDIKGLSITKARSIQGSLGKAKELESVTLKLEELFAVPGMSKSIIPKLIKKYKHTAADKVLENPYILMAFQGIGFNMADKVAVTTAGYSRIGIERKKAAVLHVLELAEQEGDIWVFEKDMLSRARDLIMVKGIDAGRDALLSTGQIIRFGDLIAMKDMAETEKYIAEAVLGLVGISKEQIKEAV